MLQKIIAFYLPQFHPMPENDAWWGKGFTEWTNVTRSQPQFPGHVQPRLPADLGFYDLRLPEARTAQTDLARKYGIDAFCYYHYWFHGKRYLNRPFDEVLNAGEPNFPFCLAWANDVWTRGGAERSWEVLIAQRYSHEDDLNHAAFLCDAFSDPRYLTHEGRPVFLVMRANQHPDPIRFSEILRETALARGLNDPFLLRVESYPDEIALPSKTGFDAAVEFQPCWGLVVPPEHMIQWKRVDGAIARAYPDVECTRYVYDDLVDSSLNRREPSYKRFPGLMPSWDNTPRRGKSAVIFEGATPEKYQRWLQALLQNPTNELIFVNAWNEWAEGAILEPCNQWGLQFLEANRRAREKERIRTRSWEAASELSP